nr:E3 ubiquitin-protein ligase TRIM71-like [Lytechinus pictus]
MAAANSVEKLEKELFCAVCMQVLTSPKRLSSCDHSFCEKCLEMVLKSQSEMMGSRQLKCPMCRKTSSLPEQGVSGFESNLLVCRMIETLKAKMNSSQKGCDSCGDTESSLVTYCRDCFQLICRSCSESHQRMKLKFRNHRTVLLSDIQNGKVKVELLEDSKKVGKYKCGKHDFELKNYFCKTCKTRVCRDCVALEHSTKGGHDCTTVQQVYTSMQEKVGRLRARCQQRKEAIERNINAADVKGRVSAAKKFQEMRESVVVAKLAATTYLNEAEEQLLSKVGRFEKAFKRNVQISRENTTKEVENISRMISEADNITEGNEAPEFSAFPDELIDKIEKLLAEESIVAAKDEFLALEGTSIQSHHLALTMNSYADVFLSGVWQVKSAIKLNPNSSPVRIFCNNDHIILQTKQNLYKRPLDGRGRWDARLLSVQNNRSVAGVAVSFRDQAVYLSFRDNVDLMGIRMARISEIKGDHGCFSSFEQMRSVTPPCWSADKEMMTTDCSGRIIIVENNCLGKMPQVFPSTAKIPKPLHRINESTSRFRGSTIHPTSPNSLAAEPSPGATPLTKSPTLSTFTPLSDINKIPFFSFKDKVEPCMVQIEHSGSLRKQVI